MPANYIMVPWTLPGVISEHHRVKNTNITPLIGVRQARAHDCAILHHQTEWLRCEAAIQCELRGCMLQREWLFLHVQTCAHTDFPHIISTSENQAASSFKSEPESELFSISSLALVGPKPPGLLSGHAAATFAPQLPVLVQLAE